jgi:hypothetical protein
MPVLPRAGIIAFQVFFVRFYIFGISHPRQDITNRGGNLKQGIHQPMNY